MYVDGLIEIKLLLLTLEMRSDFTVQTKIGGKFVDELSRMVE